MSEQMESKTYTLAELHQQLEIERAERLQNGLNVGEYRVYFQKSDLTIQIDCNGRKFYEIDLEECNNSTQLLNLIFHIQGKTWGYSGGLLPAILTTLDDGCREVFHKGMKSLFVANQQLNWKNPEE